MPRFKRKGGAYSKIDDLSHDHFSFRKSATHGFPSSPSAINFDPKTQLLSIGTSTGELRIYGQPGVEFSGRTNTEKSITKIFSFGKLHQYITVQDDNSLLLWQLEGEESLPSLKIANEYHLEQEGDNFITSCCLSQLAGHFYIGTEGGNIYTLDVRLFMLKSEDSVINWTNATALIQSANKIHPGAVCSIELCPTNFNKLLIGYEKGIIVLWDITQPVPERNFPSSIENCKQPLKCVSWQKDGQKFVSAHSDSSIYFWDSSVTVPEEGPTKHYGEDCKAIQRIEWLNSVTNPLLIFTGGLSSEDVDYHHTLSVIQGNEHVVLDFSSNIVDFATYNNPETKRGKTLIVLCQQEITAFDLEAPKCPQIKKPYLYSIHSSPVTCLKCYDSCPKELLDNFKDALLANSTNPLRINDYTSDAAWPAVGGFVPLTDPPTFDLLITGHANGTVKFWDVTSSAMYLIFEVKTNTIFVSLEGDEMDFDDAAFSEFQWPPYRKVGSYDPYDDDNRLSIRMIDFCPYMCKLCVAGEGGQVLTFAFNSSLAEVRVEYVTAEIFVEEPRDMRRGRGGGLRDSSPLECKTDFIQFPAGFQPSLCVQCLPALPITAMAFRPSWGLVGAGNSKGFMVANFYTKSIVLNHPTVLSDGIEVRNITRVQSMRRSLRSSLRRRSNSAVSEEKRKITATFNLETDSPNEGSPKKNNRRAHSVDDDLSKVTTSSPVIVMGVPPEQRGVVNYLVFAETHISGGGPHVSIIATTMGSSLIRYSIEVPKSDLKYTTHNRAFPAGKDYALVHAAPIVAVFVLDHDSQPLPSPSEVEQRAAPTPNMASPHYALIVTQEQIKVVSLPSLRSKRKEKVHNLIHERISKAWLIKVKVPAAPVGASRDWNNALVIMTTIGHILIYSIPDIKLTYHKDLFILPSDQKAMQSLTISPNGETFHLCSFSELERRLLCSYNFSYHTSLVSNLHPFDGSTQRSSVRPVKATPSETTKSSSEILPGSIPVPIAAPTTTTTTTTTNDTTTTTTHPGSLEIKPVGNSQRFRSPSSSIGPENSVRSRSLSPSSSGITASKKSEINILAIEKEEVDVTNNSENSILGTDREVLASAAAFTQAYNMRGDQTSSSSSSDSESESESDDDEDDAGINAGGDTFMNPLIYDNLGEGGTQELDSIIASSLQQLESARSFYERMQKQARGGANDVKS